MKLSKGWWPFTLRDLTNVQPHVTLGAGNVYFKQMVSTPPESVGEWLSVLRMFGSFTIFIQDKVAGATYGIFPWAGVYHAKDTIDREALSPGLYPAQSETLPPPWEIQAFGTVQSENWVWREHLVPRGYCLDSGTADFLYTVMFDWRFAAKGRGRRVKDAQQFYLVVGVAGIDGTFYSGTPNATLWRVSCEGLVLYGAAT